MKLLSVLFLLIAVFLHRPAMLGGYFSNAVTIFTRWDLALLAGAFAILQWDALIRVLKSFSKLEIICILILLFSYPIPAAKRRRYSRGVQCFISRKVFVK